jgi:hypothetical protein
MSSEKDDENLEPDIKTQPDYLKELRGLSMRKGDEIVKALPEDVEVARTYPATSEKGEVVGGSRRTILTKKKHYQPGEEIRVIHVLEVVEPGHTMYIMGPKPIYGEFVNDRLVTTPPPALEDYDGAVLDSPNVDFNYDITSYSFSEPGNYRIYWQPDDVRSNTLELTVGR